MSFLTKYDDIRAGIAEAYSYLENGSGEAIDCNLDLVTLQGYLNCADGWLEVVDADLAECEANNGSETDKGALDRLKCEIKGLQHKLIEEIADVSKKKSDMENTNNADMIDAAVTDALNNNDADMIDAAVTDALNNNDGEMIDEFVIDALNTNRVDDYIEAENTNRVDDYIEAENTNRVDDFI